MNTDKFIFKCTNCLNEYSGYNFKYLCPKCEGTNSKSLPPKGILKLVYDYQKIRRGKSIEQLATDLYESNYIDLMPLNDVRNFPFLNIGNTPVYNVSHRVPYKGIHVYIKDDSQNPTFSLKDRASAWVSAYAKENGHKTIVAASTGNAGSSIAGICASQGQKAIVLVPASAPMAKLTQTLMYGATLIPVNGTYDQAFDISIELSQEFGYFNRNTAYNPITIEGKKTVAYELFHQFQGKLPSYIYIPVGDGVIISGLYRGFEDLMELGLLEKIPEIIGVQATGSNNMVSNYQKDNFKSKPANTCADSISVDVPRNFYMATQYITTFHGKLIEVSDEEIKEASAFISQKTGLFTEPASAASFAGFKKMNDAYLSPENSTHLVLLTGSGLKDLKSVQSSLRIPESIEANFQEAKKILEL